MISKNRYITSSIAGRMLFFLSLWKKNCNNALQFHFSSSFSFKQPLQFITKRDIYRPYSFGRTIPTMMPEGPEVKTLIDQLQPAVGQRLINIKFLSGRYIRHGRPRGFDEFRSTFTKYNPQNGDDYRTQDTVDHVVEWNAKGKFIYIVLDNGNVASFQGKERDDYRRSIWITLGMSGRFINDSANNANDISKARWYLEFLDSKGTVRKVYYLDTRNFGTLRFSLSNKELMDKLNSIGPDILNDCTLEIFTERMKRKKPDLNICKFLMNQKNISGV